MELTIIQNGALYDLQHGASKKYRGARNKRAIVNKIIRTDGFLPVGNDLKSPWQRVIGGWNSRAAALKW